VRNDLVEDKQPLNHGTDHIAHGVKRALDIVLAFVALVVLAPVLGLVAIAIARSDGRPVLFRQVRPGRGGQPFTIVKFRTMRAPRVGEDRYRTDSARVTRLGRFLRSSSLDELPELWNVLRGDMSLVGPRPLLMEYLTSYTARQARRHEVRPGITSWAIVNGRHALTFQARLELDVWYVEHWSLALDFRILGMTAAQVIRRKDVTATQDVDQVGFPLPQATATSGTASDYAPHEVSSEGT
jgi:lipopolysaccharide/colanic/teichoic acid biosynthesis glycosyltransferase